MDKSPSRGHSADCDSDFGGFGGWVDKSPSRGHSAHCEALSPIILINLFHNERNMFVIQIEKTCPLTKFFKQVWHEQRCIQMND